MAGPRREILVLLKDEFMSPGAIGLEVECLNRILFNTECPNTNCQLHELIIRNRITTKPGKILESMCKADLGPFRFLICKN